MIDDQRIETPGRYDGHTEEDEHTGQQWLKLMLQARVIVTEHQEDDENHRQAQEYSQAGAHQYAGDHGQGAHAGVSETVYISLFAWFYAKYALDQRAPGI
jgi:hypothetical protein